MDHPDFTLSPLGDRAGARGSHFHPSPRAAVFYRPPGVLHALRPRSLSACV